MQIESLGKWITVSVELSAKGYSLYMTQYGIDRPEGFHAWFLLDKTPGVEIVTHSQDVHDAILQLTHR